MENTMYLVQECTWFDRSVGVETICVGSLDEVKNFMKSYKAVKKPGCGRFYFLQKGMGVNARIKSFRENEMIPEI